MSRIKIKDLPRDMKVSEDEMKMVRGGIDTVPLPDRPVILAPALWTTRTAPPYAIPISRR